MRIDSPKMTNTEATGSYSGSFIGDGSELTGLVSASHAILSDSASFIDSANVSGLTTLSSSLESRVAANELFSSSLDTTELVLTGSFTGSYTGSFTGSFAGVFEGEGAGIIGVISSSYALTSSYNENAVISGSIIGPNWIDFTTGSDQPTAEGRLGWDDGYGTLSLGLKGGNVSLQIGQEQVARVFNADSVQLTDGMVVYISGSQGNRVAVKRANALNELGSANTLGMVTEPINVGAEGFITTFGVVNGLNTLGLTPGAPLWLNSGSGEYSQNKPNAPYHNVLVGYVERVHETVGSIFVKVDNGYEIEELHNVVATNAEDGDLLVYSGSLWYSKRQLSGSYGLTGSLTADTFIGIFEGALSQSAQIADDISGSLGTNATLIRSLTAAGISGSFTSLSSSFEGRISTNEDAIDSLTLVTSSYAIEANISGSFTSLSQSVASDINEKLNIADTGSFAKTDVNNVFDGTQTFTNIAVNGTGSFAYIESITGSAKIIGDAFIVVNSEGTGSRFAGIQVIDSGSATTSSLQWDSLVNKWQYLNSGDVGYSGGGLLSGPRITGSQTVNEISYPTLNTLTRGQGGDHLYDSNITDDDTNIILGINTQITGSLGVTGTITGNVTGNLTGNASTATSATSASYASNASTADSTPSATNADTVDSLHASSFLRSDADDTGSGKITLTYHTTTDPYSPLELRGGGDHTGLYINPHASKQAHVRFATNGSLKWQIRVPFQDGANTPLKFYSWDGGADKFVFNTDGSALFNGGTVWTSVNDGSGTGLDADTVDSLQASSFLRSDADDTTTGLITLAKGASGTLMARTGFSDAIGYNPSYGMYIGGGASNADRYIYAGGYYYDGSVVRTLIHSGNYTSYSPSLTGGGASGNWNINITGTSEYATRALYGISSDTRNTASTPETQNASHGIRFDFKANSTNGLSDGGTYNGVMYWRKYGSTTDWSGGGAKEIAYTDNGNLWHRYGTSTSWGAWRKIWDEANDGAGSGLDADLLDGNQASAFATLAGSNSFSNSYNEFGNGVGSVSNDGNWNGRLNLAGSQHARLDVTSVSDGIITTMFSHTGQAAGKIGTMSNHPIGLMIGGGEKVRIDTTGNITPNANNTQNLGSTTLRWANIYTNDLHLSNMHKEEGNDVDGTTGDWTIQEGEENLYIINNLTGKKYKIKLEEV